MSETSERTKLTLEQALPMLPPGDSIHTFIQGGMCLIGADWARGDVVQQIRECGCELSGPQAVAMNHGLVTFRGTEPVFIETVKGSQPFFDPIAMGA